MAAAQSYLYHESCKWATSENSTLRNDNIPRPVHSATKSPAQKHHNHTPHFSRAGIPHPDQSLSFPIRLVSKCTSPRLHPFRPVGSILLYSGVASGDGWGREGRDPFLGITSAQVERYSGPPRPFWNVASEGRAGNLGVPSLCDADAWRQGGGARAALAGGGFPETRLRRGATFANRRGGIGASTA